MRENFLFPVFPPYNTHNRLVSGYCPSSGIWTVQKEKQTQSLKKWICFRPQSKEW